MTGGRQGRGALHDRLAGVDRNGAEQRKRCMKKAKRREGASPEDEKISSAN
jgi:hypothetical protein